jgi:hypothetical protein
MNIIKKMRRYVAGFSLAALIASSLAIGVAQAALTPFVDVPAGEWYEQYVANGVQAGYFSTEKANFYPGDNAIRAEIAHVLRNAFSLPVSDATGRTDFTDIDTESWYGDSVITLVDLGIAQGYKDAAGVPLNIFGPGNDVTRAEFSKMIANTIPLSDVNTCTPPFKDHIDHWGEQFIVNAWAYSIVDGYPDITFRPDAPINRAEIAKMIALGKNPVLRAECGPVGFGLNTVTATTVDTVKVCYTQEYGGGALLPQNYSVKDAAGVVNEVLSVKESTDPKCVLVTLKDPTDPTKTYNVTVSSVVDPDGGELVGKTTLQFPGFKPGAAGDLTAFVDTTTPEASPIPKNGANILYSIFGIEASSQETVHIDQLVISRDGLGLPGDFRSIKLYVDGVQQGGEKTISTSTNTATFTLGNPIVVAAGKTVLIEVRADMEAQENSQNRLCIAAAEDIVAVGESSGTEVPVGGSFSLCGKYMTTTSAVVGTLTYKVSQPSTSDINIGDTDVVMTKVKMDMAHEDVDVMRITFKQTGSADAADFANPTLYLSGVALDTAVATWEGDFLTFDLSEDPIFIEKGSSKTVELWVDAVGGLNTTAAFDIYRDWHIEGTGRVYGYGVNVEEDTASAAVTTRKMIGGKVAFALSSNNPIPGDVSQGADDHEFLRFNISTAGDAVTIRAITLDVAGSNGAVATNISDIKIWEVNATTGELKIKADGKDINQFGKLEFTDTFDVPGGKTTEYVVTADIANNAGIGETYSISLADVTDANNIEAEFADGTPLNMTPGSAEITGGTLTGNNKTVAEPSVTVSLAATPGDKSHVKNNMGKEFVAFNVTASTANDMKVTGLTVNCVGIAGPCDTAYQNLYLYQVDGSTLTKLDGPDSMNQVGTTNNAQVTFSLNLTIPAGDSVRLLVKGDIASAAVAGAYTFSVQSGGISVTTLDDTGTAVVYGLPTANRTITVTGAGILTNSGVSGAVTPRILVGGATDEDVLQLRFNATPQEAWWVRSLAIINAVQYAGGETTTGWTSSITPKSLVDYNNDAGTSIQPFMGDDAVGMNNTLADGNYLVYNAGAAQALNVQEVSVSYYYHDTGTAQDMILAFCESTSANITDTTNTNLGCYVLNNNAAITKAGWVTETITVDPINPINQFYGVVMASTGVFEPIDTLFVDNVRIGQSNDSAVSKVYMTYNNGSADVTAQANLQNGVANFNLQSGNYLYVPAGQNTTALVTIDVGTISENSVSGAHAGDFVQFLLSPNTNFEAVGASSTDVVNQISAITGPRMRVAKSAPTLAKKSIDPALDNGEKVLYSWGVTADDAGDIALKQFTFGVSITDSDAQNELELRDFRLFINGTLASDQDYIKIIDAAGNDCKPGIANISCLSSGQTATGISVQWEDPPNEAEQLVTVANGEVLFQLRASALGTETGDSVSVELPSNAFTGLAGDLSYGTTFPPVIAVQGVESTFIWSDLSDNPHLSLVGGSSFDWLDGYLVSGLGNMTGNSLSK